MARPLEDGVKYFPLDTGFYRDKKVKLLRQRYGAKAVYILTVLWADIYESAGYFKKWDEDDCLLMADAISCGCSPELIGQVIDECVRQNSEIVEQKEKAGGMDTRHTSYCKAGLR